MGHGGTVRVGRVHPSSVPDRRGRDSGCTGAGHRAPCAGHVRPAVGADLGRAFRAKYGPTRRRDRPGVRVSTRGLAMIIGKVSAATARTITAFVGACVLGLSAAPADGHPSYAMYDGSVYRVFTGVIVRVIPSGAHFEMHFVPLNEARNALVRDENGEQLVWVVQMESAARRFEHCITRERSEERRGETECR